MNTISENPSWTSYVVALIMTLLTMGVSLGWWNLENEQLAAIQEFVKQISPILIAGYFALAAWWTKRQTIATATIKRHGIQAAMKQSNMG